MRRRLPKFGLLVFVAGLGLGLGVVPAWAHRVLVFAFAEGNRLVVESKFVGSGPVQDGIVLVLDKATGEKLATGMTDANGKYSCPIPEAAKNRRADLLVAVEAEMGHRGEFVLKADQYLPAGAGAAPTSAGTSPPGSGREGTAVAAPELEAILDKALEKHLTPLREILAASQVRTVTVQDIIGGIGYIVGLCGLWAYFLSRKKS